MQDEPAPDAILAAVADQLRNPAKEADRAQFQARVAAGAIDLARRALALGLPGERLESARLQALLSLNGDLATLNAALAERLRCGRLGLSSPGVSTHLWATTLEKLAVDQPRYATHRAVLAERGGAPPGEG